MRRRLHAVVPRRWSPVPGLLAVGVALVSAAAVWHLVQR